jgi:hypothetical protein
VGEEIPTKLNWTKADEDKAKEIVGSSDDITPEHIKQFGDYLTETGAMRFGEKKAEMVNVLSPDGRRGKVSASELEQAIKEGYKQYNASNFHRRYRSAADDKS